MGRSTRWCRRWSRQTRRRSWLRPSNSLAWPAPAPVAKRHTPRPRPPITADAARAAGRAALSDPASVVREETPALDAEVLLRHLLGLDRATLLAHPGRRLTLSQWRRYRALLRRR